MTDQDNTSMSQDQDSPDTQSQTDTQDRGTFVPLIFGGAVACALGFFGGQLDGVARALGLGGDDLAAQSALEEQSARITALSERLDAVPTPQPVDLSAVEARFAELSDTSESLREQIGAQETTLADITERLTSLEKRPMTEGVSEQAMAAYQAELDRLQDDLRGSVAEQKAEIAAQLETLSGGVNASRSEIEDLVSAARQSESEAQAQAQAALVRASIARIVAAVESGAPYSDVLAELTDSAAVDVPDALNVGADTGVATLAVLQDEFPPLARASLSAARGEAAAGGGGGLLSFVERRLGARSVTPREGDGADAVLSRAEAALRSGQLDVTLSELSALSDAARAPLADWMTQAELRDAALRAAAEMMSSLGTN